MNLLGSRSLGVILLLLALSLTLKVDGARRPGQQDGTLTVLVTWGDVANTPADDVYIEAHGFVVKENAEKSFVLKKSRAGRYETSLPEGIYDVFVSEGTSEPRCRRIRIRPGLPATWTLKLEVDEIYTNK